MGKGLTFCGRMSILNIERALPISGWPPGYIEVTVSLWERGRLLLFIDRDNEADNADNYKRILKKFSICNH